MTQSRKGFTKISWGSFRMMAVYGSDVKKGILGLNGLINLVESI